LGEEGGPGREVRERGRKGAAVLAAILIIKQERDRLPGHRIKPDLKKNLKKTYRI